LWRHGRTRHRRGERILATSKLPISQPLTQRRRGKFPGTEYVVDLVVEARLAGKVFDYVR
jgi:hypothetical protein